MTGCLWPVVLLLLASAGAATDLDSVRTRLLRTHPDLQHTRLGIDGAEADAALAGLREPVHLETELQPQPFGPGTAGTRYRLELGTTVPLDGRLERARTLGQQEARILRAGLCRQRGELLAVLERDRLTREGRLAERASLARALATQDSLLELAGRMVERGELSALQQLDLRHRGQELRADQLQLEQELAELESRLALLLGCDTDQLDLLAAQDLNPGPSPLPAPDRVEAQERRHLAELARRSESRRRVRELELGLGLEGSQEDRRWTHGPVLRLALPLPDRVRQQGRFASLANREAAAEADLLGFRRTLELRVAGLDQRQRGLANRRALMDERRVVCERELELRRRAWAEGQALRIDLLAARLDHILLEREQHRLATDQLLLDLDRASHAGTLAGTHDPQYCHCQDGSPDDEH